MSDAKSLSILLMDPPYESANVATAFRMVESALNQGHNVSVFAFEGAVSLSMSAQKPHPNPVHGTSVEEEQHPTTKDWVSAMFRIAKEKGVKLEWINCGFCVDERGAGDWVDGPRRGGPPDFFKASEASDATLVIGTHS